MSDTLRKGGQVEVSDIFGWLSLCFVILTLTLSAAKGKRKNPGIVSMDPSPDKKIGIRMT